MKRFLFSLCLLVPLALVPAPAEATHEVRYGTVHPYPPGYADDFCYVDAVHVHEFAPFDRYLFNRVDGVWYFVGDPLVWGYDATVYLAYAFAAHHPIPRAFGGAYCYLEGVHHHHWTPNHPYLDGWVWDTAYWVWGGAFTSTYYRYADVYRVYYRDHYRPRYPGARVTSHPSHHTPPARVGIHLSPGLHGASASAVARPEAPPAPTSRVFVRDDRVFSRPRPLPVARPAPTATSARPAVRTVPASRVVATRPTPRGASPAARPTRGSAVRPTVKTPPAVKPRPALPPRPATRPKTR